MTNPTYMTTHYGPIVEFVKGAKGHIRKNKEGFHAVAFVGEEVHVKTFEGTLEGRDWIREREA